MAEDKVIINKGQKWDLQVILKTGSCFDTFSGEGQEWFDRTLVHCKNICKIYEGSRVRYFKYEKSKINNENQA